MKFKKQIIIIFSSITLILSIMGLLKINVINTKALSPVGNTDDNKKIVNTEFGEDFSNFIQDDADVKIYNEGNGDYLLNINDNVIRVKKESDLVNWIKEVSQKIGNGVANLVVNVQKVIEKIIS